MPKADLHTHSVFSDGTSSPREVVIAAQKTGVGIFALADHDTVDGVLQAQQECEARHIPFVPAVEISTREHDHLHFLGLNVNIHDPQFAAFLAHNRQVRVERIKKIIAQLQAAGLNLTPEDVFSRAPNTVSRAHVADALKQKGIVPSRQEGFRRWLVPGSAWRKPSAPLKPRAAWPLLPTPALRKPCGTFPPGKKQVWTDWKFFIPPIHTP